MFYNFRFKSSFKIGNKLNLTIDKSFKDIFPIKTVKWYISTFTIFDIIFHSSTN